MGLLSFIHVIPVRRSIHLPLPATFIPQSPIGDFRRRRQGLELISMTPCESLPLASEDEYLEER